MQISIFTTKIGSMNCVIDINRYIESTIFKYNVGFVLFTDSSNKRYITMIVHII